MPTLHNAHLDGSPFFWGAGPVGVLLLHGFTATPVEVRSLAERLCDRGYTVAGPLLPGHGTVPEDLNRVRWQDWVDVAEGSYQQLAGQCDRVFIAGESMGGVVALYLASEHPEALGVMVYAPAIELTLGRFGRFALRIVAPFVPWRPKPGLDEEERWQGYRVDPLRGAGQLLRLQRETRRRLARIRQPLMVVMARLDTTVDPGAGKIILDGVRSETKELYWMEQSRHVILLGPELDQVTDLTLRFMTQALEARSGAEA
jgi:carboxylesterase